MPFKEAFANKASLFKTKRNREREKLDERRRKKMREKDIKIPRRHDISLRFASVKVIFAL